MRALVNGYKSCSDPSTRLTRTQLSVPVLSKAIFSSSFFFALITFLKMFSSISKVVALAILVVAAGASPTTNGTWRTDHDCDGHRPIYEHFCFSVQHRRNQ
ncbi:hypothetical protein BT96DRAFT_346977 [Gymnopus androsaceus JB14]|uniref:Uncharacterized protein n=1 Tax=Gymnopus androsaceus JB14 TaxID=1447944 RepID=A0A6A4I8Z2_9AGAR|nr:hypothetical protein BT96DRAFT_346977 [Gymnopus androsaceus JB14]